MSGYFSIIIDQMEWTTNGIEFHDIGEGEYHGVTMYEGDSINKLESFTLHVAVYFE